MSVFCSMRVAATVATSGSCTHRTGFRGEATAGSMNREGSVIETSPLESANREPSVRSRRWPGLRFRIGNDSGVQPSITRVIRGANAT